MWPNNFVWVSMQPAMSIYLILTIVVNCHPSIIFNIKTWVGGLWGASLLSEQCLSRLFKFSLQNHNLSLKTSFLCKNFKMQSLIICWKFQKTYRFHPCVILSVEKFPKNWFSPKTPLHSFCNLQFTTINLFNVNIILICDILFSKSRL